MSVLNLHLQLEFSVKEQQVTTFALCFVQFCNVRYDIEYFYPVPCLIYQSEPHLNQVSHQPLSQQCSENALSPPSSLVLGHIQHHHCIFTHPPIYAAASTRCNHQAIYLPIQSSLYCPICNIMNTNGTPIYSLILIVTVVCSTPPSQCHASEQ